jgi:type I restriction enzyme M protein
VVSNPPYSQNWDPANKDSDPRYSRFGLAPKSKADYAFLLHDLYHVKPGGIMTIVLPHGVLFRGGEEETIRKNLIEQNHIDAIIGLPANIFFGTGIPTIIMVLKQKRDNTDVLIIDASKGFTKVGKNNKLQASDIKKIVDTVVSRESAEKYAKKVERDEIRKNGYNLNIPRYVDSSEKAESWDIYATMFGGIPYKEIDELEDDWQEFPSLKNELFRSNGTPYATLAVEDINAAITNNRDVKAFADTYKAKFADFGKVLETKLIDNMNTIVVTSEENAISESIFTRLTFTKLIDKYKAYQLLDDHWNGIEIDLEIIQTEGFAAVKQVDPNMVIKKKNGKDEEVQEGYVGHIIPFNLVQSTLLKEDSDKLKAKENLLCEIQAEYNEILENLTEDEKEDYKDCFNEDGDAYVPVEVAKEAKILAKDKKKYSEDTIEWKIIKVSELLEEERFLKKIIKINVEKLHAKTKATIENLTDGQALELLKQKWIAPLVVGFAELPSKVIADLTVKVKTLAEKYKTTLLDTENEIKESEKELCAMIYDFTGDEFDMQGLKELQELLCGGKE